MGANAACRSTHSLNHKASNHARAALAMLPHRQDALPLVSQGRLHHPSLRTVRKRVYASPMHAAVSLAAAERAAPRAAQSYPDICFSVLDFHDAFDDVVSQQRAVSFVSLLA